MNRASKIKLQVAKPPTNLHFSDSLGKRGVSVYVRTLTEALNSGGAVQIAADDQYMRNQIRMAAKKLSLRLAYALDGDVMWIKPLAMDDQEKRLLLLLREPRSLSELEAAKLELHLRNTLARLAKDNVAHVVMRNGIEKWLLTSVGLARVQMV